MNKELKICVVGLGYVGLPLLYHFAEAGFANLYATDINKLRLEACSRGLDHTDMVPSITLDRFCPKIDWVEDLPQGADVYVLCVPTPDINGVPNYAYVDAATESVMNAMGSNSSIVIESTVAPDTIRTRIIPKLHHFGMNERTNLVAFSPERINPGPTAYGDMVRCTKLLAADHIHPNLQSIVNMYWAVFEQVEVVNDTRVAEVAKCFENMQRDVNIALMNELSMICHRAGIDHTEVMRALRTKTSSPKFQSGLVGGHCIPVDPYYLAAYYDDQCHERLQLPIIGRKINEEYINYVTLIAAQKCEPKTAIAIIGATYKANVTDTRNSGSLKIAETLKGMGHAVVVYDSFVPHSTDRQLGALPVSVIVGAVDHHNSPLNIASLFTLTIDCTFINVGQAFGERQLQHFPNIINI